MNKTYALKLQKIPKEIRHNKQKIRKDLTCTARQSIIKTQRQQILDVPENKQSVESEHE